MNKARLATLGAVTVILLSLMGTAPAFAYYVGQTSINKVGVTTNSSPQFSGHVPAACSNLFVVSVGNDEQTVSHTVYWDDTGMSVDSNGNWTLNSTTAGFSLPDGSYNAVVAACDGGNNNWLYADSFVNVALIIPTSCDTTCLPLYRFYDFKTGAHFYTASDAEKRQVMGYTNEYRYEGLDSFVTSSSSGSYKEPVYRFYNRSTGVHFYTTNFDEDYNLIRAGYSYENIAYYAYSGQVVGSKPVYRFYNYIQGLHFFTSNQNEATYVNDNLSGTYRYEGVAFYAIEK